jgi:hypothetical protein
MTTMKLVLAGLLSAAAFPAAAQTAAVQPRAIVFGAVGHAQTWDDEGLLGGGTTLSGGVGYRLMRRLTLQAIVDRIPYYRDVEWLTFDGRILFVGAEAAFQSASPRVRPFAAIGIGILDDEGIWIRKTTTGPGRPRIDEQVTRDYLEVAMTSSAGIDFALSDRAAIRTTLRVHGLVSAADDLAPHLIIQPGVGLAWRW